jgi:hypothetical protein
MTGPAVAVLLKKSAATASRLLTPNAYISCCSFESQRCRVEAFKVSRGDREDMMLNRGKEGDV